MNFQECPKDCTVYRLTRNGRKSIEQGRFVEASQPHLDRANAQPGSLQMQMVMDVTIDFGGKPITYVTPERTAVIYTPDNGVISTDLHTLLREVEADKARSEEAIKMHDAHVENIKECDALLEQWNPSLKEKRETDRRITALEEGMGNIKDTMAEMLNLMKKGKS